MVVYILTKCCDDEYGCMAFEGVFSTAEKAHAYAKEQGWQNEFRGKRWCFEYNYYEVHEFNVE